MYYQIKVLKGRNAAVQKKIELVFGKKITSGTHLMFRKSNCEIVVRNYNLNAGTLEFEISDKSQAEVLASSFSKILKGTSILLATVQPVRWFSELEVREYRDGKLRNVLTGRGTKRSTTHELIFMPTGFIGNCLISQTVAKKGDRLYNEFRKRVK